MSLFGRLYRAETGFIEVACKPLRLKHLRAALRMPKRRAARCSAETLGMRSF